MVVTTVEELKRAIKNEEQRIEIYGDLARHINSISKIGVAALMSMVAGNVLGPIGGGITMMAARKKYQISKEAAAVLIGVGILTLVALFKNYDRIDIDMKIIHLVFERK